MTSHFLISAPASGTGKTTLTLGVLGALAGRGLAVAPFKCGPDYIDTALHAMAAGRTSVNLDLFLGSEEHARELYARYGATADVAVTEGVMGLFDGYDRAAGSSAAVAEALDIPVVLAVDARSAAYSAAPLLWGFSRFSERIRMVGAIFNFVSSARHERILRAAAADAGVETLGVLPRETSLAIPARRGGLTLDGRFAHREAIAAAAAAVGRYVDLDRLLELGTRHPVAGPRDEAPCVGPRPRVAVARDEAFSFIYTTNLAALESRAEVVFFSPLADEQLPEADAVYLPGGYPELFLAELSGNESMRQSLRDYAETGGRVWAEGGGAMVLHEYIADEAGRHYPMAGVFAGGATMQGARPTLGYRSWQLNGRTWRGHEFHYSRIDGDRPGIARLCDARGEEVPTRLWRHKNALGSYAHLYWGEHRNFMELFDLD